MKIRLLFILLASLLASCTSTITSPYTGISYDVTVKPRIVAPVK